MKEFKEYLEQVGLRGQSFPIGAKKLADKLKETLESIISSWKSSKKQNLLINYNLPGYGVSYSINKLLGSDKDKFGYNPRPNHLESMLKESNKNFIIFDDFNTIILRDKNYLKILNAEKTKKFVFIINSFKPIQIKSPTLKSKTLIVNLVMDAEKGTIEVK